MENFPAPLSESNEEQVHPENTFVYPLKFQKPEKSTNIWLRSISSLALYLVLGYYIFPSYKILLLITVIVMIHELGHFFAMKYFHYSDLGIFFIPLLGAYASGSKREVSQKESAIILLAGPLPGIALGVVFHFLHLQYPDFRIAGTISFENISLFLIFLNIINLLPVYPLDGGQLLNRVFFDEGGWISKIFIILSAGMMCWVAWSLYNSSGHLLYFALLLFPLMMLSRLTSDSKFTAIEKKIEGEGINLDTSYEDLPDEDYWKIRQLLIKEHPSYKDVAPAPPYEYSAKEEKIMTTIQSLLHRHLIQDISIAGKIFIVLLCFAALATPWLLQMDILSRFRF
jgi:Zn-dependent protease